MSKNPRLIDLSGQRFGLWTVREQAGNSPRGAALWHAVCDCGGVGTPMGTDLRSGKSTSCGCLQRFAAGGNLMTHGEAGTRLHRIWKGMNTRTRGSVPGYSHVTLAPEWRNFSTFRDWSMANGYADDLSIDRKDNDLGYSPSNCRWATRETQAQNRRFVLCTPDGTPWAAVAKANGIKVTLMHSRLHEGWPIEKAATLPVGSRLRASL
jgi:hypothetical protein